MTSIVSFERPSFAEIATIIRRISPVVGGPDFGFTPNSISRYLEHGGSNLLWQHIPDWERYEFGRWEISDEEFVELLFSPGRPSPEERIVVVTDECFSGAADHRGFSFRFGDILPFARDVYPQLHRHSIAFFQPADMIFVAEQSRLIVLLHHGRVKMQFAG